VGEVTVPGQWPCPVCHSFAPIRLPRSCVGRLRHAWTFAPVLRGRASVLEVRPEEAASPPHLRSSAVAPESVRLRIPTGFRHSAQGWRADEPTLG
jgi:hypothetical protein